MIHYVTIERGSAEAVRLTNNDGNDAVPHAGVSAVELTVEQHYGLRIYDDDNGRTCVRFREGGDWTTPVQIQDLLRARR